MPTLKGLLRQDKPTAACLIRSLNTIINGIGRYAVDGRDDELATFRDSMLSLAARVHDQSADSVIESSVQQALDLLREFNACALRFNETHASELKMVMRTMTETITFLSESRTRSVHQLQFVERELEQASEIDDIRLLRSRLINCLDVVKEETVRLQNESVARSQEVREQIGRAANQAESSPRFGVMDVVTGLPSRRAAERTISENLQAGKPMAAAVFVVTRLSSINSRYGRGVGDEVMLRVANHFAQHLSSDTLLYRWSGPALLALINARSDQLAIQRAWAKAAAGKQEINLDVHDRSVFVVIETAMSFQIVATDISTEDLFISLDKFVADTGDCGTNS